MNNKQTNKKGDKMRKMIMALTLVTVFATSAQAYVYRDNGYMNGMSNSYYNPPVIRLIW